MRSLRELKSLVPGPGCGAECRVVAGFAKNLQVGSI